MNDLEKRIENLESEVFQLKSKAIKKCNIPITERVKSYEDACRELEIFDQSPSWFSFNYLSSHEINTRKLEIIITALNEGWKPDWNNFHEYKYFPYFSIEKYGGECKGADADAGLGSCFTHAGAGSTNSGVGSRLCFKTRELAEYAGKQFKDLYECYYLK